MAFTLPDGSTKTVDQGTVSTLASIPVGGSVDVPTKYAVPVVALPGTNEADAAYLSRLAAVEGATLTAKAPATGTGAGSALTATTDPMSTTEHLPIVSVGKSDPATIDAGDTGTYQLPLQDTGGAGASGIALTDSVPAGGTATITGTPASLAPGAAATAAASFPVPADQPDGPLMDTAQVRWTEANGNHYCLVSASFTTTVQFLAGRCDPDACTGDGRPGRGRHPAGADRHPDRPQWSADAQHRRHVHRHRHQFGERHSEHRQRGCGDLPLHRNSAGQDTAQATATAGSTQVESNTAQIGLGCHGNGPVRGNCPNTHQG